MPSPYISWGDSSPADERVQIDCQWLLFVLFWRTFHNDGNFSPAWWEWGCTPSPLSLYHEQSCGVRSSWEGRYTPPISALPFSPLCLVTSFLYTIVPSHRARALRPCHVKLVLVLRTLPTGSGDISQASPLFVANSLSLPCSAPRRAIVCTEWRWQRQKARVQTLIGVLSSFAGGEG